MKMKKDPEKTKFGEYGCPKCGYDEYINDSNYEHKGFYMIRKELKREKYPKYGKTKYLNPGYMGGARYEWDETHWCPKCRQEFTVTNSAD
jgi:predicted nucleic-acid-binding Zn-ribbon protein